MPPPSKTPTFGPRPLVVPLPAAQPSCCAVPRLGHSPLLGAPDARGRPYFEDFKVFLNRFVDEIGLEGDPNGPRLSVVTFEGSTLDWTSEESTTHMELSTSKAEVQQFVDALPQPAVSCTETGGCTCISCGAEVAWARIPTEDRSGEPPEPASTPDPPSSFSRSPPLPPVPV